MADPGEPTLIQIKFSLTGCVELGAGGGSSMRILANRQPKSIFGREVRNMKLINGQAPRLDIDSPGVVRSL